MKHAAGLLVLALSCASDVRGPEQPDPPDPASPSPSPTVPATTLTSDTPQRELPIPALAAAPAVLVLEITRIQNPAAGSFSIAAGVTWSAAGAAPVEEALGVVTPFPANQPGSFQLAVPPRARELLTRKTGRLALRLALQPMAPDRPLPAPLEVTFGASSWR